MTSWVTPTELLNLGFRAQRLTDRVQDLAVIRGHAAEQILAPLRSFPQQRAVFQAFLRSKQFAICAPRRTGKTEGAWRTILARMVKRDGYVVRLFTDDLSQPTNNFLEAEDKTNLMQVIEQLGLRPYCHIARSGKYITRIRFDWGSVLHVQHIAHASAAKKRRGSSADLFWFDEAQDITMIGEVMSAIIRPMMADSRAQVLLTGTPGSMIGSYFYTALHSSVWGQGQFYSWDNPHFGATDAERWGRILDEAILPGRDDYALTDDDVERLRKLTRAERIEIATWTGNPGHFTDPDLEEWVKQLDPTLLEEYFGVWPRGGKGFVFQWHNDAIYWCATQLRYTDVHPTLPVVPHAEPDDAGLADVFRARLALLPDIEGKWRSVMIADPGTPNGPSGSALVALAYTPELRTVYELYSHVAEDADIVQIIDDDAPAIAGALHACGVAVDVLIGDFAGVGVKESRWQAALASQMDAPIPIRLAEKSGKNQQIHAVNLALRRGALKVIHGSRLDLEGRYLRWKTATDGTAKIDKWRPATLPSGQTLQPGDHCLDALRYGLPHARLASTTPIPKSPTQKQQARTIQSTRRAALVKRLNRALR